MIHAAMNYASKDFCGSPFWNSSLTWSSQHDKLPDVTTCFENLILEWFPSLSLWIMLIPYIKFLKIHIKGRKPQRANSFILFKTIAALVLLFSPIYELIHVATHWNNVHLVEVISPLLAAAALVLASGLIHLYRRYGQYTSGPLWVYWLIASITAFLRAFVYYKRYFMDEREELLTAVVIYTLKLALTLVALVLASISDASEEIKQYYQDISPEHTASFPSLITFHWMREIMRRGYVNEAITRSDLFELSPENRAENCLPDFQRDWFNKVDEWRRKTKLELEQARTSPSIQDFGDSETTPLIVKPIKAKEHRLSLISTLSRHWLPLLMFGWLLRSVFCVLEFGLPLIQSWLITFMDTQSKPEDDREPLWKGIFYCVLVIFNYLLMSVLGNVMWWTRAKVDVRVLTALVNSIYKKALTMSGDAKQESTNGEIVNLMSVDAESTREFIVNFYAFFEAPLKIGLAIYLLYQRLGNAVFAGLACLLIPPPLSFFIAQRMKKLRKESMKIKDERIRLMNEALSAIKIIKLYAWEESIEKKICDLRRQELVKIRQKNILIAAQLFMYYASPLLVTIVSFAVYTITKEDHVLEPHVAFVSLSLFELLKAPFNTIPNTIATLVTCSVSIKRIVKFFKNEDLSPDNVTRDESSDNAVEITDGSFSWLKDKPLCLKHINMTVKQGSLSAVVGRVGTGKSSVLSALIGDMYKHSGQVTIKSSMAYVSQQAFILNATLRDNILFGSEYDEALYNKVMDACALTPDLEMLPKGDKTAIGEKGINLSGGQKQRVSIARAVYNNADIYLLDDPLSAVDAHVGKHIFDNVIGPNGLLKDKTRIMVTHGVHWLPLVDEIFVMKHGSISEHGSYNSLLSHDGEFAQFLKAYSRAGTSDGQGLADTDSEEDDEEKTIIPEEKNPISRQLSEVKGKDDSDPDDESKAEDDDEDEEEEEVQTGNVTWAVYKSLFQFIGARFCTVLILLMIFSESAFIFSFIWMSMWTGDPVFSEDSNSTNTEKQEAETKYISVYSAIGLTSVLFISINVTVLAFGFFNVSVRLHQMLLSAILRTKMAFFDTKPLGQILNRFSKDMDIVDNELSWSANVVLWIIVSIITSIIGVVYSTPLFIIIVIPILGAYVYIQRYYVKTSRQLRRLKSKAYSPIYSHFGETLTGLQTIRAYNHQERFEAENLRRVEECNVISYFDDLCDCWLEVRMDIFGGLLVCFTCLFSVISTQIPYLSGHITPSLMGLAITLVIDFTSELNGMVWVFSNLESNIVALERIKEYCDQEKEADWFSTQPPTPHNWPESGRIVFEKLTARYRPELDDVLKGLTVDIHSGEKIGIAGRTGAGKSSLTIALFRLIEASGGCIRIDGRDISTVGLHELRNNITIIPQDPVLFSGTLRENLDPFTVYTDDRIWQVLELCHLKDHVVGFPDKLQHECGEGGQNLSLGQRQLVCLARALLRKTRILVIDEATSAVDLKTDDLIQETLHTEFSDCTILTIAHRIKTILNSDRIMVIDNGRVAEFDSPQNLLNNQDGIFHSMAASSDVQIQ